MIYNITEFEESFKSLLQQEIVIKLNDKILRKGKLVLFTIKNYCLIFSILQNKAVSKLSYYELPVPFSYIKDDNAYSLSYKIEDFHENDPDITISMKLVPKSKLHKLYDKNVIVYVDVESE